MKRIWIALILLGMVLAVCGGGRLYLHRQTDRMLDVLDRLEVAYNQGDTVAAARIAEEYSRTCRQITNVMDCFVPHDEVSPCRETAALLPALIRQGGEEELRMELARMREQLWHLMQVDDPLWGNIL